jgi:cysteine desulfurase / selenocysteine lyase
MDAPTLPKSCEDGRIGSRTLFPTLEPRAYLNHAGLSPTSAAVTAAVNAVLADLARRGAGAFPTWMAQRERLRERLGRLVGAPARDIALTGGTSRGLIDVSCCVDWRARDRVLVFEGEFPANVTPWQRAAAAHDLQVDMLPLSGFGDGSGAGLARVEAALNAGGVRLVAVSAVQFQTGLRMPLRALGELCRRHDALLCVDAIQAVGATPLDVTKEHIDILATGTHKWLMGLDGFGFAVLGPRALAQMTPRIASWLSHEDPVGFLFEGKGRLRYDRPIRKTADFLEIGAWPTVGFAALEASVAIIESLGVESIYAHIQAYHDAIEGPLLSRGFTSLRSSDPAARSGLLCFRPPHLVWETALHPALETRGVACAIPDGNLRLSPHWPNHLDEVPRVLAAMDAALTAARHG